MPYSGRWGYFSRCGLGINTNIFCEAFHRVFKYNYLNGKQKKRVDKCLVNLLKYNCDKTFDRIIKLTKSKMTQRLKMIQDLHQNSLSLNFSGVNQVDADEWQVESEKQGKTYTVKLTEEECDGAYCVVKCVDCNTCLHKYTYTCYDFLLYCVMCKHIHLVCKNFISGIKLLKTKLPPLSISQILQQLEHMVSYLSGMYSICKIKHNKSWCSSFWISEKSSCFKMQQTNKMENIVPFNRYYISGPSKTRTLPKNRRKTFRPTGSIPRKKV